MLEPSSPVFAGNFDQDWGVNTFGDECLPSATQPAGGRVGKKKNSLEFEAILQDFVLLTFLVSMAGPGLLEGSMHGKMMEPFLLSLQACPFLDFTAGQAGDCGFCCWSHQGEEKGIASL